MGVIYTSFHYGLKGQKHIAQGKANRVSRHPGCNIHQFPLRPERPKAHSPGQGEQGEPTPWVFCIHHQLRPEGAKAFFIYCVWGIITSNPCCKAFALSGRRWWVWHYTQGAAPCGRLPWAGRCCPFRALLNAGIQHTQGVAPYGRLPWAERCCPFRARNDYVFSFTPVILENPLPPPRLMRRYSFSLF